MKTTTPATCAKAKGAELKANAIRKLRQATALIDSAREDMSNLEGTGYCASWEKLYDHGVNLRLFAQKYERLQAPTGVFRF